MSSKVDVTKLDLYDILGILQSSSVQEIKKAYRKKALTCHPDKNPDNPKAAELFHQLSKALEILTDEAARAAYDKVLKGRQAAKLRHKELDAKRQKLKDELEAREKAAREGSETWVPFEKKTPEEKLLAEIERLRKEGNQQVKEEQEYVRKHLFTNVGSAEPKDSQQSARLKVKWKAAKDDSTNGGYNYDILNKIFSKYGPISILVVSEKKKGSALIEFENSKDAELANQIEHGLMSNPLVIEWVGDQSVSAKPRTAPLFKDREQTSQKEDGDDKKEATHSFQTFKSAPNVFAKYASEVMSKTSYTADDYESLVLRRLRQAEERKRLIEELKKEDS